MDSSKSLLNAVKSQKVEELQKVLSDSSVNRRELLSATDSWGWNALHWACDLGDYATILTLNHWSELRSEFQTLIFKPSQTWLRKAISPLEIAIEKGHYKIVVLFLSEIYSSEELKKQFNQNYYSDYCKPHLIPGSDLYYYLEAIYFFTNNDFYFALKRINEIQFSFKEKENCYQQIWKAYIENIDETLKKDLEVSTLERTLQEFEQLILSNIDKIYKKIIYQFQIKFLGKLADKIQQNPESKRPRPRPRPRSRIANKKQGYVADSILECLKKIENLLNTLNENNKELELVLLSVIKLYLDDHYNHFTDKTDYNTILNYAEQLINLAGKHNQSLEEQAGHKFKKLALFKLAIKAVTLSQIERYIKEAGKLEIRLTELPIQEAHINALIRYAELKFDNNDIIEINNLFKQIIEFYTNYSTGINPNNLFASHSQQLQQITKLVGKLYKQAQLAGDEYKFQEALELINTIIQLVDKFQIMQVQNGQEVLTKKSFEVYKNLIEKFQQANSASSLQLIKLNEKRINELLEEKEQLKELINEKTEEIDNYLSKLFLKYVTEKDIDKTLAIISLEPTIITIARLPNGYAAAHIAVQQGNILMVEALISKNNAYLLELEDENKNTPFHLAAEASDNEMIKLFIAKNVNYKMKNNAKETPYDIVCRYANLPGQQLIANKMLLDVICEHRDEPKVSLIADILNKKAEVNLRIDISKLPHANTPMKTELTLAMYACQKGWFNILKLLARYEANLLETLSPNSQMTAYHYAESDEIKLFISGYLVIEYARTNQLESLKKITASMKHDVNYYIDDENSNSGINKFTALHVACVASHTQIVEYLLAIGAHYKWLFENDFYQMIKNEEIKKLIANKMIENAILNETTFFVTGQQNQIIEIEKALELQADINLLLTERGGLSLLMLASKKDDKVVVPFLLKHGAKLDLINNRERKIALDYATDPLVRKMLANAMLLQRVRNEDVEGIKTILKDADIKEAQDENGLTALHLAVVYNSNMLVMNCLFEHGANVDATDNAGKTALHHAAALAKKEMIDLLLEKQTNINKVDQAGQRAFDLGIASFDIAMHIKEKNGELNGRADEQRKQRELQAKTNPAVINQYTQYNIQNNLILNQSGGTFANSNPQVLQSLHSLKLKEDNNISFTKHSDTVSQLNYPDLKNKLKEEITKIYLEKIGKKYKHQNISNYTVYAWDGAKYEQEVKNIVEYLRLAGIDIPFDRNNGIGAGMDAFLDNLKKTTYITIFGTRLLTEKYEMDAEQKREYEIKILMDKRQIKDEKLFKDPATPGAQEYKTIHENYARDPIVKNELKTIRSIMRFEGASRIRTVLLEGDVKQAFPLNELRDSISADMREKEKYFIQLIELVKSYYVSPINSQKHPDNPYFENLKVTVEELFERVNEMTLPIHQQEYEKDFLYWHGINRKDQDIFLLQLLMNILSPARDNPAVKDIIGELKDFNKSSLAYSQSRLLSQHGIHASATKLIDDKSTQSENTQQHEINKNNTIEKLDANELLTGYMQSCANNNVIEETKEEEDMQAAIKQSIQVAEEQEYKLSAFN